MYDILLWLAGKLEELCRSLCILLAGTMQPLGRRTFAMSSFSEVGWRAQSDSRIQISLPIKNTALPLFAHSSQSHWW